MRTVNFILPKNWAELDEAKLLFVSKLFLSDFAKLQYEFLTHAFIKFSALRIIKKLPLGIILKKKGESKFMLRTRQVHALSSKLQFLLEGVTELKPISRIRFARAIHQRLYNTPFIVFLMAENYYMAFKNTNDPVYLDCLCETLYRRRGKAFDDNLIKKRSRYYRFVRMHKKYTVFLWYSGFRWYVSQECPHLFRNTGSGSEPKIKDHVRSLIRGLTEGDVTRNGQVLKTDTWQALYELDAKAKDAKTLKEQMEKMKNHV